MLRLRLLVNLAVLLLAVVMLSGCAGMGDYPEYADAMEAHSTAEGARIAAQAEAIADAATGTTGTTATEQALLATIAMMQIERLQPVPLGIAKPTTGYDVALGVAQHIPFIASTWGMLRLGEAALDAAGNISIGDGASVTESLNDNEIHTTGYSTTSYQGTADPAIVEPFVVGAPVE